MFPSQRNILHYIVISCFKMPRILKSCMLLIHWYTHTRRRKRIQHLLDEFIGDTGAGFKSYNRMKSQTTNQLVKLIVSLFNGLSTNRISTNIELEQTRKNNSIKFNCFVGQFIFQQFFITGISVDLDFRHLFNHWLQWVSLTDNIIYFNLWASRIVHVKCILHNMLTICFIVNMENYIKN